MFIVGVDLSLSLSFCSTTSFSSSLLLSSHIHVIVVPVAGMQCASLASLQCVTCTLPTRASARATSLRNTARRSERCRWRAPSARWVAWHTTRARLCSCVRATPLRAPCQRSSYNDSKNSATRQLQSTITSNYQVSRLLQSLKWCVNFCGFPLCLIDPLERMTNCALISNLSALQCYYFQPYVCRGIFFVVVVTNLFTSLGRLFPHRYHWRFGVWKPGSMCGNS